MPPRAPARRRHLQLVPEPHPLITRLFPALDRREVEVAAERVREYGQREPIEILDGAIVAGWHEYMACVAAGVVPTLTEIAAPDDLVEYLVRRNVPRHLSKLDRACIAVLAQVEFKRLGVQRMREGGRMGGLARVGKGRASVARPFEGERWTHTAARVVGTTEGAVRRLAHLYANTRDVFQAVRARKIDILRDARDLAQALSNPKDRAEVLRLRKAQPKVPVARLVADVMRTKRPAIVGTPHQALQGFGWNLYDGPMAREAKRIASDSIDLVHADIIYGSVPMATDVARIAMRVLVPGGVLALIPGNSGCLEVQNAVAAEGLELLTIGSLHVRGGYRGRMDHHMGRIARVDSLPILFFSKGKKLNRPLSHIGFVSEEKNKEHHHWGKNLAATLDIVKSTVDPGARVMDPCAGGGTTGEAALRAGCVFIGIEIDPQTIKVAAARLANVERELAGA